jgi:hypothetical protein
MRELIPRSDFLSFSWNIRFQPKLHPSRSLVAYFQRHKSGTNLLLTKLPNSTVDCPQQTHINGMDAVADLHANDAVVWRGSSNSAAEFYWVPDSTEEATTSRRPLMLVRTPRSISVLELDVVDVDGCSPDSTKVLNSVRKIVTIALHTTGPCIISGQMMLCESSSEVPHSIHSIQLRSGRSKRLATLPFARHDSSEDWKASNDLKIVAFLRTHVEDSTGAGERKRNREREREEEEEEESVETF